MANVYIRDGASGSGADWSDALDQLPTTLVRGNTYYIADGSYPTYTFNDAVSGTQLITIKKASSSDHGTETGWQSTYGDGQAVWDQITVATDYWVFDGAYRNESNWEDENAYGFDVLYPGDITINASVSHLTFRYIDVGAANGTAFPDTTGRAIDMSTSNGTWRTDILFSHMHVHNTSGIKVVEAGEVTMEYMHLGPGYGKEMIRSELGHNWVIKYCHFIDNGPISAAEGQTAIIGVFNHTGGNVQSDNWEIYGCVFGGTGTYTLLHADGLLSVGNVDGWKFYHNTITHTDGTQGGNVKINGTNNEIKNCLWYWMGDYGASTGSIIGVGQASANNSWCYYKNTKPAQSGADCDAIPGTVTYGTEDPFTNEPGLDYRIKSTTFSGPSPRDIAENLGSPYNIDANGITHDNIGAYATEGESGEVPSKSKVFNVSSILGVQKINL